MKTTENSQTCALLDETTVVRIASRQALAAVRPVIERLFLSTLSDDVPAFQSYIYDVDVEFSFWERFGSQVVTLARMCHQAQAGLNIPEYERFRLDYYDAALGRWTLTHEAIDVLREVRFRLMTGRAQRDLERANRKIIFAADKFRAA